MEIRAADWPDLACLVRCEAEAFELQPRAVDADFAGQLESDVAKTHTVLAAQIRAGQIHVAMRADEVVGYVSVTADYEHLFVGAIAVLPAHQRQGLGSRLLAFAEQTAARRGMEFVSLYTDGLKAANLRFYTNRGYGETDRTEGPDFLRVYYSKLIVPVAARAA